MNLACMKINSYELHNVTDGNSHNNEVHLNHLPAVRGDCHESVFINQVQRVVLVLDVRCKYKLLKRMLITLWCTYSISEDLNKNT